MAVIRFLDTVVILQRNIRLTYWTFVAQVLQYSTPSRKQVKHLIVSLELDKTRVESPRFASIKPRNRRDYRTSNCDKTNA